MMFLKRLLYFFFIIMLANHPAKAPIAIPIIISTISNIIILLPQTMNGIKSYL